jgi:hypothetical protein
VDGFPDSTTRTRLADEFEKVVQMLRDAQVVGELWVDGSFLTRKIDPNDIDFILRVDGAWVDAANETQHGALQLVIDNLKEKGCHAFVHVEYDQADPRHAVGQWMYAYWLRQWGFSREGAMKGIAVIKLEG